MSHAPLFSFRASETVQARARRAPLMSTWTDREIVCMFCGEKFVVKIASGLHISRLPAVREQVLRGELHGLKRTASARCRNGSSGNAAFVERRCALRVPLWQGLFLRRGSVTTTEEMLSTRDTTDARLHFEARILLRIL
jgi:hypothetical protein